MLLRTIRQASHSRYAQLPREPRYSSVSPQGVPRREHPRQGNRSSRHTRHQTRRARHGRASAHCLLSFCTRLHLVVPSHYKLEDIQIVHLQEAEKMFQIFIGRMPSEDARRFYALHTSRTKDGSGPILRRVRTNGFTIGTLPTSTDTSAPFNETYAKVGNCDVGSRFNHRYER